MGKGGKGDMSDKKGSGGKGSGTKGSGSKGK